ncbi:hypothetical protein C162_21763 [Paenibacillus sp. FSL R7-269]|uniref:right-handed parallel beta-helix repeat-containing protein n=1 Tax=Paenibacillus sp. FSL R7-269 TaxID=1226755 RepID=UPI0003E2932B|nr:right-handed parallel beta-helix repeat-containing protein [Paenibacillus sp. FSL R7-269]ETT45207.1 hypothetical protein C162_21763 [Paenibacillus sp. FSL R7-269]
MKTTSNLGLKKPEGTDLVDIDDLNANADILDTSVKALQDHAADTTRHITETERNTWNAKASTAAATTAAAGLMSASDKSKLDGVANNANNYTHPSTHPPGIIVQDASNRFVTDAEKSTWNAKASTTVATTGAAGLMSAGDKSKLDGVATNANNYTHPSTHPPGIIVQDASNRFVSDSEKAAWNGKANLATTPQQTTADVTYYVRTDGNDANTGLANTAGGAFKTIAKAVSMIPIVVNHTFTINVGAGTYNEDVYIGGQSGKGEIKLLGSAVQATTHIISGISLTRISCRAEVSGFVFNRPSWNGAFSCIEVVFSKCVISSVANDSAFLANCSKVYLINCSINNRNPAVYATVNSEVLVQSCTGSGNGYMITCAYNSRLTLDACSIGSTNKYATFAGGIVVDEANGIINPWGDNTPDSRTFIDALGTSQNITESVMTKVQFPSIAVDLLGEFSASKFTAAKTGQYLICACVILNGFATDSMIDLTIFLNGTVSAKTVRSAMRIGAQTAHLSIPVRLGAGSTIEIYINASSNGTIGSADGARTFLSIQREA